MAVVRTVVHLVRNHATCDALAHVLEQLVCSGELRERLGAAGRRRVLDVFSTERYVAGVTEVYERLLGR